MITGEQIRRARELLGWTPYRLAPRAGIGHTLLRQLERAARPIDAESAARLRAALKEAGVEFLDNDTGEGVRLRVCNGATVDFTNGEPRDPSARNPSRAACSGCFEDAAASGGSANKKPGRFCRPGFDVTRQHGRGQRMKQHHARNRALFPCGFVN